MKQNDRFETAISNAVNLAARKLAGIASICTDIYVISPYFSQAIPGNSNFIELPNGLFTKSGKWTSIAC